jgi:hypothetical protein
VTAALVGAGRAPVDADSRTGIAGRTRILSGYDAGLPAPPRPPGAAGGDLAAEPAEAVADAAAARLEPVLPPPGKWRACRLAAISRVLGWLAGFVGQSWEERWIASGADAAPRSWAARLETDGVVTRGYYASVAAFDLIALRVLRPSYHYLLNSPSTTLCRNFTRLNDTADFGRLRTLPGYRDQVPRLQADAELCAIRVMARTGKTLTGLSGADLLDYADLVRASGRIRKEHLIWELLVDLGGLAGEPRTLRAAWTARGNSRQHSTAALVDRYAIPASGVRDLLVDYLGELRQSLDYSTLESKAYILGRLFWRTVLDVNPAQDTLRLDRATITGWRERLAVTAGGTPRTDVYSALFTVRGFYRDLQQWAAEDPVRWGIWAAPSPVRDNDLRPFSKAQRQVRARMQQRTRVLTGLLPAFTATALGRRDWSARLLEAATAARHQEEFNLDGVAYRSHSPRPKDRRGTRSNIWVTSPAKAGHGAPLDVTSLERDCFWAWAVSETLRLTGCRIEEVLELTQLSLRHYTPPSTGKLVPLLHIIPSKTDAERLIPMSPELVAVLVAVQRRTRGSQPQIPLSVRYDPHEKQHGPPLPHLFARRVGARQEVLSQHYVRTILNAAADAAGIAEAGRPVTFTPHDFRRLFTTEMIGSGLPLHIAAALLGHIDLETTRGYTAVFPDEVIRHHQEFIARRRAQRDSAEYRDVTTDEWADFEKHFQLRRVELGDCFRPYGTPCVHEHACIKCPFLRIDPDQLPRLELIEASAISRLAEARERQWLGEVSALEDSLRHIRSRKTQAAARP